MEFALGLAGRRRLGGRLQRPAGANRALIESVRGLVDHIAITPFGDARGGPVKITLHGDLSRFLKDPAEHAAPKLGTIGSWGRDRTADLWVMNPPL